MEEVKNGTLSFTSKEGRQEERVCLGYTEKLFLQCMSGGFDRNVIDD